MCLKFLSNRPKDVCCEAALASAELLLHITLIPSILYHIETLWKAELLCSYCLEELPILGSFLEKISVSNIVEALSAKSSALDKSYDLFEYVGDAVLKVTHTDDSQNSSSLQGVLSCLHEGDLSLLRSKLGSNDRLFKVAMSLNLNEFILSVPLALGQWLPSSLEFAPITNRRKESKEELDVKMKVIADVMESIVGKVSLNI